MQRHALTHMHTIENSCARRGLLERAPVSQKSQKCGSLKQVFFFFSVFIEQFEKWMVIRMWKKKNNTTWRADPAELRQYERGKSKKEVKDSDMLPYSYLHLFLALQMCLWLDCSEHRQFCGTLPAARALGLAAAPVNPVGVFPLPGLRAGSCPREGCWQCQLEQLMLACWQYSSGSKENGGWRYFLIAFML